MTYSPLWEDIVDSSLWTEPYFVRVLFTSMLAIKDAQFMVYGSAYKFANRFKMKEEEVIEGLRILSSPDTRRIEPQPFEGRRIEKRGEEGWFILNGEKYRNKMSDSNHKSKAAINQARYRERKQKMKSIGTLNERIGVAEENARLEAIAFAEEQRKALESQSTPKPTEPITKSTDDAVPGFLE